MHFANMGKRSAMVPQCHLVETSLSVRGGSKESPLGRFDNKKVKKVDIFLLLIDLIHLISY